MSLAAFYAIPWWVTLIVLAIVASCIALAVVRSGKRR